MLCGKLGEPLPMEGEHRIRQPENSVRALARGGCKCPLKVVRTSHVQELNPQPQCTSSCFRVCKLRGGCFIIRITEHRHARKSWEDFFEQLQPFAAQLIVNGVQSCCVAARAGNV